jgi:phosphoribosylaminoimidazole-succinocarboxamide synthase
VTYCFDQLRFVKEGKTKVVRGYSPGIVDIREKNDMTAGNGTRHELVPGKGKVCAAVTVKMFELAGRTGVEHALIGPVAPGINRMHEVDTRPFEVVGRFRATGSYCKRHPEAADGTVFDQMVVEFYLKTKDKVFGGIPLPDDDPLIIRKDVDGIDVVHPALRHGSEAQRASLVHIPAEIIYAPGRFGEFDEMEHSAREIGKAVRDGWASVLCDLWDFKVEFGKRRDDRLVLADSLSPDEMRLRNRDGELICKEPFRKGAHIDRVVELYVEAGIQALRIA